MWAVWRVPSAGAACAAAAPAAFFGPGAAFAWLLSRAATAAGAAFSAEAAFAGRLVDEAVCAAGRFLPAEDFRGLSPSRTRVSEGFCLAFIEYRGNLAVGGRSSICWQQWANSRGAKVKPAILVDRV